MKVGETQAVLVEVLKNVLQNAKPDIPKTFVVVASDDPIANLLRKRFCEILGWEGIVFLEKQNPISVRVGNSIVLFVTNQQTGDRHRFRIFDYPNINWFHDYYHGKK